MAIDTGPGQSFRLPDKGAERRTLNVQRDRAPSVCKGACTRQAIVNQASVTRFEPDRATVVADLLVAIGLEHEQEAVVLIAMGYGPTNRRRGASDRVNRNWPRYDCVDDVFRRGIVQERDFHPQDLGQLLLEEAYPIALGNEVG
jgi:hypothetical protein